MQFARGRERSDGAERAGGSAERPRAGYPGPQRVRPRIVAIVPHTHWDREWYSPFQTFRLRLVKLLDALLPMLEGDLSYARFLLDGQTAVLDDYLEIRPEAEAALTRAAVLGLDLYAITEQLQADAIKAFASSFDRLLATVAQKRRHVVTAAS